MDNDFILVLDLGGPEAVATARKLRYQGYYTEIMEGSPDIELFRRKSPRGILLVGGEDGDGAGFPRAALALGIPVLAMGGAARMLAQAAGAQTEGILLANTASQITFLPCPLFDGLTESDRYFTRVDGFALPEGFKPIATTIDGLTPAFADVERSLYALQFYAESNDPDGAAILSNFAGKICGCTQTWSIANYLEEEIRFIREKVGESGVLMAVSGGVDSTTCAALMRRAVGEKLRCVFVDNGFLRIGEAEDAQSFFRRELGIELIRVDARARFMSRLRGVKDPEEKHRAMHNEFLNVMDELMDAHPECGFLAQGTIYSDLLSSTTVDDAYARRFSGGALIEPLRMLFKDEVRELAELLGLPQALINRQPFPGPALAVRCAGEVTEEKLAMLRRADAIFREEIEASGQDRRLSRYFAVLTDTLTLGRPGGEPYGYACALRAVAEQGALFGAGKLPYDLLERIARRITSEAPGINRVVYDITDSSSAEIEWE